MSTLNDSRLLAIVRQHGPLSTRQVHTILAEEGVHVPMWKVLARLTALLYVTLRLKHNGLRDGGLDCERTKHGNVWQWEPQCNDCLGLPRIVYINSARPPWVCQACNGRGIRQPSDTEEGSAA